MDRELSELRRHTEDLEGQARVLSSLVRSGAVSNPQLQALSALNYPPARYLVPKFDVDFPIIKDNGYVFVEEWLRRMRAEFSMRFERVPDFDQPGYSCQLSMVYLGWRFRVGCRVETDRRLPAKEVRGRSIGILASHLRMDVARKGLLSPLDWASIVQHNLGKPVSLSVIKEVAAYGFRAWEDRCEAHGNDHPESKYFYQACDLLDQADDLESRDFLNDAACLSSGYHEWMSTLNGVNNDEAFNHPDTAGVWAGSAFMMALLVGSEASVAPDDIHLSRALYQAIDRSSTYMYKTYPAKMLIEEVAVPAVVKAVLP